MRTYLVYGPEQPFLGKVSVAACLGRRTHRPRCCCCGGANGIRRPWRKFSRYDPNYSLWIKDLREDEEVASRGRKPRYKDHR